MLTRAEISTRLEVAVEAHRVSRDSARLVRGWMDSEGRIAAPNERCADLAREVLEAAGLEYRPAKDPDLPATPGEMDRTGPETETPDADRGQKEPVSASSRASQRPRNGRKGRNRTEPPNQPAPPNTSDVAEQATPSRPPRKSAIARSRAAAAWAAKEPAVAAKFLRSHPAAVLELLAPDAEEAHGDELHDLYNDLLHVDELIAAAGDRSAVIARIRSAVGVGERQLLDLVQQLPSTVEVDGEPLSVLAAAREALTADRRDVAMLPATPSVRVVEAPEDRDTLPLPPTPPRRQLTLPNMVPAARDVIAPAAWLQVFDRLGGNYMAQGRGVPVELRLFVEALAWAPPAARRGILAEVDLTVRDLVQAIWPNGWRRNEDLPKLVRGIDRISAFGVLSDGRFRWRPLWFQLSPDLGAGLDDPVRLYVQLPAVSGTGAGARFDRDTLRRLGLRSAPAYRLYLALIEQWDRKLRRGLHPHRRKSDGVPMPLPGFSPADRRRLIFGPDETAGNASTLRSRRAAAERAFIDLAQDGVIDLQVDHHDPRIYRPRRLDLD